MKTGFFIFSLLGVAGFAGAAALEESPINRIQNAHYICQLSSGEEAIAFRFPTWRDPAHVWLTMTGNEIGLDTVVESFSFLKYPGEYEVKGHYVFSGALNRYQIKTDVLAMKKFNQGEDLPPGSEDLPPGSEDAPPGSEDLPPGSGDEDLPPGSGDPDEGDNPGQPPPPDQTFDGPDLHIRYQELSADGKRITFQVEGDCVASAAAKPWRLMMQFGWRSWAINGKQKPAGN